MGSAHDLEALSEIAGSAWQRRSEHGETQVSYAVCWCRSSGATSETTRWTSSRSQLPAGHVVTASPKPGRAGHHRSRSHFSSARCSQFLEWRFRKLWAARPAATARERAMVPASVRWEPIQDRQVVPIHCTWFVAGMEKALRVGVSRVPARLPGSKPDCLLVSSHSRVANGY